MKNENHYKKIMIELDGEHREYLVRRGSFLQSALQCIPSLAVGSHVKRKVETAEVTNRTIAWDSELRLFVITYTIRKLCKDGHLHLNASRITSEDMRGWKPIERENHAPEQRGDTGIAGKTDTEPAPEPIIWD